MIEISDHENNPENLNFLVFLGYFLGNATAPLF